MSPVCLAKKDKTPGVVQHFQKSHHPNLAETRLLDIVVKNYILIV
jgi:hypothetical protein